MARFGQSQPVNNDTPIRYQTPRRKKPGWYRALSKTLFLVFRVVKAIFDLLGELIEHLLSLISASFNLLAVLWKSPHTHYVASILLFIGILIYAIHQWIAIGMWLAKVIHAPTSAGAFIGGVFGIGINIYQLTPLLWKIDPRIAKAYAKLGINPYFEPEDEEQPAARKQNWKSHTHRSMQTRSVICFVIEWALFLIYWVAALRLSLLGLVSGFISLWMPRQSLKFALHCQQLMEELQNAVEEDEYDDNGAPSSKVNL